MMREEPKEAQTLGIEHDPLGIMYLNIDRQTWDGTLSKREKAKPSQDETSRGPLGGGGTIWEAKKENDQGDLAELLLPHRKAEQKW